MYSIVQYTYSSTVLYLKTVTAEGSLNLRAGLERVTNKNMAWCLRMLSEVSYSGG